MILFAVYPGWVRSKNDWQQHYIGARQLMQLYGVRPNECVVVDPERPETYVGRRELLARLMPLQPMTGVDYSPIRPAERERLTRELVGP